MRLALDRSARRLDDGRVVLAGSPLTLFRLGPAGKRVLDAIEHGEDVPASARSLVDRLVDTGAAHPRPSESPYTAADVTVVIPVHGHDPTATAASVGLVAGVIIVDDATNPPLPAPPSVDAGWIRVVRHDRNRGVAAARMTGLAEVRTPFVAFVDADCRPEPGWLGPLVAHLGDERIAAVAPRVRSVEGRSPLAAYEASRSPLDLGSDPGRVAPTTRVAYVPAAALVVRVDAVRAVGGFDETLRTGEDVDLVWRLVEQGWRIRYEPRSVVRHQPRSSVLGFLRQRAGYGRAAAPLHRRHPGAVAPAIVGPWPAGGWVLMALGHAVAGLFVAAVPAVELSRTLSAVAGRRRLVAGLTGWAFLRAGEQLASAVTRVWWPVAVAAAALVPRLRRPVLVAAVVPPLVDWLRTPPRAGLGPLRYVGLRLLDDLAYGAGVWAGVVAERDAGALLPRFSRRRRGAARSG